MEEREKRLKKVRTIGKAKGVVQALINRGVGKRIVFSRFHGSWGHGFQVALPDERQERRRAVASPDAPPCGLVRAPASLDLWSQAIALAATRPAGWRQFLPCLEARSASLCLGTTSAICFTFDATIDLMSQQLLAEKADRYGRL